MVQIANLVLGLEFKDLLVEVTEVEGIDPDSKPDDPAHSAIVGDATGHIRLVYRAATAVRPTQVKKGKTYLIAGKVTSHDGHIQIQIGSSWGKISLINGQKVPHVPPYCEATDLSAPERRYGAVLLRGSPDAHLQAFARTSGEALPSMTCSFMETDRTAACRALEGGLEMLPNGFRLLPVVPVECYERKAKGIEITSIFAAVETDPADKFSIGALGQWLPMSDLLQQVPDALRRSLQALLQQLAQASSVGLIDLKVADTASGIKTAHPAPEDQSNSHDQSLESCMQNAKITDNADAGDSAASSASYRTEDEEYWASVAVTEGNLGAAEADVQDQPSTAPVPEHTSAAVDRAAEDKKAEKGGKLYPEWHSGKLHHIKSGGAEAQSLLDRLEANTGIAIVIWFAHWADSCRASIPALERLAGDRSDVPFMLLDIEESAPNRALAMEKALTRPQSQRRTAKPVLRGEQKFPAFSLHIAPSLQPQEMFTGPSALKDLAKALAVHPRNAPLAEAAAGQGEAEIKVVPEAKEEPSKAGAKQAPQKSQKSIGVIKRGAPDLKQKLQDAQAAGQAMAVLWTSAAAEAACYPAVQALQSTASTCSEVAMYEAPSDMSKANGLLAEALGVKSFPTLQVFGDMKLQKSFPDCTAERIRSILPTLEHGELPSAATGASAKQDASSESAGPVPEASQSAASKAAASSPGNAGTSESSAHEISETSQSAAGKPAASRHSSADTSKQDDSHFAPLTGKDAVSGAQRPMPGGNKGVYWPKMPCLRCGCPWYSGEDWDALCMRCGWDCQISGYDDESQPLPPFRAQWQEFTAAIKEGRTPAYTGKRTKVRS